MNNDELFYAVGKLLDRRPIEQVIPILITATARVIVIDANGDLEKLDHSFLKFCNMVRGQMADMITQDMDEAREATKQ